MKAYAVPTRPERCLQAVSLPDNHELHRDMPEGLESLAGNREDQADADERIALTRTQAQASRAVCRPIEHCADDASLIIHPVRL